MDGWRVLTEIRQLRGADQGRLVDTPAQRLAMIAHGDGIRTTLVTEPSLVLIRSTTICAAAGTTAAQSGGISS